MSVVTLIMVITLVDSIGILIICLLIVIVIMGHAMR